MKISPIQNDTQMPASQNSKEYSPVSKLQQNQNQEQLKASSELQQSQDLSSSDPETENEELSAEIEYFEKSANIQKMLNPAIKTIENQYEEIQHVGNSNNYYKNDQDKANFQNAKGITATNDVNGQKEAIKNTKNTQKEVELKKSGRKKNRRYYQSENTSDYNNDNSLIESSTNSLFSNQEINIGKKRKEIESKNRNRQILQQSEIKLIKKDSLSSSVEILDSRKKQMAEEQNNQCSKLPIKRYLTFLLMYQISFGYFILVSLLEDNYFILIALLLILIPTYYGYSCVKIAKEGLSREEKTTQNISNQQFFFKDNSKIFNSFYSNVEKQGNKNNINQVDCKNKSNENSFPMGSFYNELPKQNLSRWSFASALEPSQCKSFMLVIPYMENNQVHQISKCEQCNTVHKTSKIKHCNRCRYCHFGYDHYCKWLLVCIDGHNYSYFFKFVISLWVIQLALIVSGVLLAVRWSTLIKSFTLKHSTNQLVSIGAVLLFIGLETILSFLFSSYILFYHIYLNCQGVTTRQHLLGGTKIPNNTLFYKSLFHNLNSNYRSFFMEGLPYSPQQSRVMCDQ